MKDTNIFSDYACTLVSCWPKVPALIYAFNLRLPVKKKSKSLVDQTVTAKDLIQALDDSYDLVDLALIAHVDWQKLLNTLSEQRQIIRSDLSLLTSRAEQQISNKRQRKNLSELETHYKAIEAQKNLPDAFELQLETWRQQEINPLIDKWTTTWQGHKRQYAEQFMAKLQEKHDITLSELEKNELLSPTRTRAELITELYDLFPKKIPKGFNVKSDLFQLRCLWCLAVYRRRILVDAGGDGSTAQGLDVLSIVAASEKKAARKLLAEQKKNFKLARQQLHALNEKVLSQAIGLTRAERGEQRAILVKNMAAKPEQSSEDAPQIEPE